MTRGQEKLKTPRYRHSGLFAWRTALLPFADLFGDSNLNLSNWENLPNLDAALEVDRDQLHDRLRAIVARPVVREAIFLASPSLEEQIDGWLAPQATTEQPDADRSKKNKKSDKQERAEKVERSLLRYVSRACGRATPFGLFAGCSVGRIDRQTRLVLDSQSTYRRHTRLDMEYLCALATAMVRDQALQGELLFRPNSTINRAAGSLRYAEGRFDGNRRSYHLVVVEETDYLAATLSRAAHGARAVDLAAALVDDEISLEEAQAFIAELIETQLLVSELEPPVTGPEPIHAMIDQLESCSQTAAIQNRLIQTRDSLAAFDSAPLGIEPARYRAIATSLEQLPTAVQLSRLFQVDMVKPASETTLGTALVDDFQKAIEILHGMAGKQVDDSLSKFCTDFQTRYGDRMIPLAEVLDEETGIGFEKSSAPEAEAGPLLAGLSFPSDGQQSVPWGARQQFLLRKLFDAQSKGSSEIELTPDDLRQLATSDPQPLPDAISVAASVAAKSLEDLQQGKYQVYITGISGPSGARLLGRFCHGDARLEELVQAHLQAEEAMRPDAVFAEVVHLPEGRIGNVLLRPVLRGFEIPFAGRSGAPDEQQIDVADLMVSVAGGRVLLYSRRLGKEVIPRMSTAHNFTWNSLGVYRFLCQLQTQSLCPWLSWSWGSLGSAPFLPRVKIGRLVLSRARWSVSAAEIKELTKLKTSNAFRAVQQWRKQRRLPRFVSLADDDNELPFDLDRVLSVEMLLDSLSSRSDATLIEFFPTPDDLVATGPEGKFVHELVVPMVRIAETPAESASQGTRQDQEARSAKATTQNTESSDNASGHGVSVQETRRYFAPGSEWLYFKIYCGTAAADRFLRHLIRPLTTELLSAGVIDRWFFIRYSDPDWHLRLRLHGEPHHLLAEALPMMERAAAQWMAERRIHRWQLDTYDREIERYGGGVGIELAESIFYVDSEAALSLVEVCPGDVGLDARWRLALVGIDRLLNDFGFPQERKLEIMRDFRNSMSEEFNAEAGLVPQLAQKFRTERKRLEELLAASPGPNEALSPGLEILAQRSGQLAPILAELHEAAWGGQLEQPLESLSTSYIHMFVNRLLRSAQRAQEFVLYDFLTRLYQSQAARSSKS
jgi:lantibiotic biosynthesis protein